MELRPGNKVFIGDERYVFIKYFQKAYIFKNLERKREVVYPNGHREYQPIYRYFGNIDGYRNFNNN